MSLTKFHLSPQFIYVLSSVLSVDDDIGSNLIIKMISNLELHLLLVEYIDKSDAWLDKRKTILKLSEQMCRLFGFAIVPHLATIKFSGLFNLVRKKYCIEDSDPIFSWDFFQDGSDIFEHIGLNPKV